METFSDCYLEIHCINGNVFFFFKKKYVLKYLCLASKYILSSYLGQKVKCNLILQDALVKSNEVFETFKQEIEKVNILFLTFTKVAYIWLRLTFPYRMMLIYHHIFMLVN